MNDRIVDFLIITPLEEERDALLGKLPTYQQHKPSEDDIRVYYSSTLPVAFADESKGEYSVVVMPLLGMGRVQATVATGDAIRKWKPRYVLLVGIAGGVAKNKVKLGDVIISNQIVDYELQKITPDGPQVRWEVYRTDPRILGAAKALRGDDWQNLVTVKRPGAGKPVRRVGPILSGDKVIAFAPLLEKYRAVWPKVRGVEMEAGGVAIAAFQSPESPGFFMVRGVSDLADHKKGSSRVEKWRSYACEVAAAYAIALLKSGPVLPSPERAVAGPAENEPAAKCDLGDSRAGGSVVGGNLIIQGGSTFVGGSQTIINPPKKGGQE